ncbi:hypothetical protein BX070DRAFT_233175 [Coemansia spiralis]|nr:hypothetical protein BX070DRAFT_233175 [Coemansia spiralis]
MERLALKVLLEGNASSQQLEVLYLASIYSNGDSFRIEVIDRWYDINSAVDAILVQIIRNGGLCVGDKISCAGPHANGLSEGNSVRRDRWHTKLGFQPKRMMYMSLSAVHELGGPIGAALDVTILRSYAMLYVETMATDQRVVRTEKEEQRIGVTFTEKRTMLLQEVL